jgi:hypothetical protein
VESLSKKTFFALSVICVLSFLLSSLALAGCGSDRERFENDYISFTLDEGFSAAFFDRGYGDADYGQALVWEEEGVSGVISVYISYPCSEDVINATSGEDVIRKTVNGIEVRYFDDGAFYYQCYLDPTMTVGILTISNDEIKEEANEIVDSLKVKQTY